MSEPNRVGIIKDGVIVSVKNPYAMRSVNDIFEILNQLKHLVGMAQCDFMNNQTTRKKAIKDMEVRFVRIQDIIKDYFGN